MKKTIKLKEDFIWQYSLLVILSVIFTLITGNAQSQILSGEKIFGGSSVDLGFSIQQTSDGGYIITGMAQSFGLGGQVYLTKVDSAGSTEWTKSFGGIGSDYGYSVQQTSDDGYIITGEKDKSSGPNGTDAYLIRTDINGDTLWTKTYGGTGFDRGYSVQQTSDGGFVIAGEAQGYGAGSSDVYFIKTDSNGDTLWARTIGGVGPDIGRSVQQTADGGYIILGNTASFGAGWWDMFLIRSDSAGNILWTKTYGGTDLDWGYSVIQIPDGGYVITGYTGSFGAGGYDVYLIRTDANGDTLWTRTIGGAGDDMGLSVKLANDGGLIIAGYTSSFGAGLQDVYLIKTDINGNVHWTKTFGGAGDDRGQSVEKTADGGYAIVGYTKSFSANDYDMYFIKTGPFGSSCNQYEATSIVNSTTTAVNTPSATVSYGAVVGNTLTYTSNNTSETTTILCDFEPQPVITFQKAFGGTNTDQGESVVQTVDGGYAILAATQSFGEGNIDIYLIRTDEYGDTLWVKTYGGSNWDYGSSLRQTADGGFIIAGESNSFSALGVYLVRIDAGGNLLWDNTYSVGSSGKGFSVRETQDGGFIVTGDKWGGGPGGRDVFLIRTDADGGALWAKTYGGTGDDYGNSVQQTNDGGFIVVGYTGSFGAGNDDVYLIKTDANGDTLWTKTYGGSNNDRGYSVSEVSGTNQGYIVTGETNSFGTGTIDVYLLRIDVNGDTLWTKTYGGTSTDIGESVQQTADKGFIIAGLTSSFGSSDAYLIKTDSIGNLSWAKNYGGSNIEWVYSVQQAADGGYILAGYTRSFGAGSNDVYFIKTDAYGNSGECHQGDASPTIVSNTATAVNTTNTQVGSGVTVNSTATVSNITNTVVSILNITTDIIGTDVGCNGGSDGAADLTLSGGVLPHSFLWSPSGSVIEDLSFISAGIHYVSITDATGCMAIDSVIINEPPLLITGIAKTDVSCYNGNDGTASATPSGGTPPYNYNWSNGQIDSTALNLLPGTYSVNVFDVVGCIANNLITITQPNALIASLAGTDATCINGSNGAVDLAFSGGTAPYTFAWSNGGTLEDISGLIAGTYSVILTDSCGAVINDTIIINEPPALISSIVVTNISCNGNTDGSVGLAVTGGTTPYTYLWSTTDTIGDISGLDTGTYTVTITDACGIGISDTAVITEPVVLTTSITGTDVSCNGGGDGTATVTPSGGTTPYSYNWNNGQTDSTAIALFPGSYGVNVFDANGCLASNNIIITQPAPLTASISGITDVICIGDSSGSAAVNISGGTPPYTYLWDDPGLQTTFTATGLPANNYTVIITDSCGNAVSEAVIINEPVIMSSSISKTDISCNGYADGSIILATSGGTPSYSYLWSPGGETTANIFGLDTGTYIVTITDSCGNVLLDSAVIDQPVILNTNMSKTDISCNGFGDGTATVTPSGGTPPYLYSWSNGQTSSTAIGLFPNTYSVNVIDANSCLASDIVIISEPPALSIGMSVTDATCGNADGSATLTASGGTTPYTYLWSNGDSVVTVIGLTDGNYSVTITDTNGCTISDSITINIIALPQPICIVTVDSTSTKNVIVWEKPVVANIDSFRIYRDIINVYTHIGSVPYNALSVFVDTSNEVNPQITSYRYKLSTIDACGNESVLSDSSKTIHLVITLDINDKPVLQWNEYVGFAFTWYRILRDSTGTGNFDSIYSVGSGILSWTDLTPPQTGNARYIVEVVPPDVCSATKKAENYNSSRSNTSTSISATTILTVTTIATDATQDNCNGSATAIVSGGNPPYTFLWDDPYNQVTQTAAGLCPGTYIVVVTDGDGNMVTDSVTVNELTGIGQYSINNNRLKVYPNPSRGIFNLEISLKEKEDMKIEIFDMQGKLIRSMQTGRVSGLFNKQIDISECRGGIYHLQIITDKWIENRKVVIE